METVASLVGTLSGFVLLYFAAGSARRGFAVRLASGLSWLVLLVGLMVHSVFASADWAWSAWTGLLFGGVVGGLVLSAMEWLVKGAGAASSLAKSGAAVGNSGRWRWLAVGAVVVMAGGVGWWFVGAESVPNEPAALVAGDAGPSCLCSQGAQCTGPRGGVYCLTDAGKKKYSGHR